MRHLAVDRDLHLQATIVRSDHLVAKAGSHHQVGRNDFVFEQPCGAQFTTKFFIIGKQQFHAALGGLGHCFQCAYGKGVGGEVAFADGGGTAVDESILYVAAIGVFSPAFSWRNHIAMGVEQNCGTARTCATRNFVSTRDACSIRAAHQQVGDGLQSCSLHIGLRHRVFLGGKPKIGQ